MLSVVGKVNSTISSIPIFELDISRNVKRNKGSGGGKKKQEKRNLE